MDKKPQLIIVEEGNAQECALDALRFDITPTELFYVRSHYPTPALDKKNWSLQVDGEVERPVNLSFAELVRLPRKKLTATMECAGNGRTFLHPPAPGLQFNFGAVGTAEWTGVSLADVLQMARMKKRAVEVLMWGADQDPVARSGASKLYERSLPLAKALDPDTLLVFEMNGEELEPDHGYPVRVIVPGWYGMASVKWLTNIRVLDGPFQGQFQSESYVMKRPGKPVQPVTTLRVKSLITTPTDGATLALGPQKISGVAWSNAGVNLVEISTDDGKTWRRAVLRPSRSKYVWQHWSCDWAPAHHGVYKICARASDATGASQPAEPDWNEQGYEINSIHSISVEVA